MGLNLLEPSGVAGTCSVRRLGAALAAEVQCGDLRTISDETFNQLHRAWLDNLVLLIRGQDFSDPLDLLAFGRRFGPLERAPDVARGQKPKEPHLLDLAIISNIKENNVPIGGLGDGEAVWHTDSSFFEVPPSASILHSIEIPPAGGNTGFANMYVAYDTMPVSLLERVLGLKIKNDVAHTTAGAIRQGYEKATDIRTSPGPSHPIVRTHPETGYNAMYLGRRPYSYIPGLPLEQSESLLDELWAHATQQRFTWVHEWQVGDVIIWDNRCVMHRRDSFDPSSRRLMYRTCVQGSVTAEMPEAAERPPHPRGQMAS